MKYSGLQMVGFVVAVILALVAAVFVVDAGIRGFGYASTAFDSIPNRAQPVVVTDEEADARGRAMLSLAQENVKTTVQNSSNVPRRQQAAVLSQPRYANAVMSYHAFGTIWRGSFVARTIIDRNDVPALRAMVYNNGTAPTNAWTFSCNWEGSVTTTHQAPLGAGERAFAVCTTSELSRGTHTVTLIYQEAGKATQSQTVSVRVD